MQSTALKYALFALALGLVVAAVFGAGYHVRSLGAAKEMADYQAEQRQIADDQKALAVKVEAAQAKTKEESTARVDVQQQEQQVRVETVTKEVIKYVQNPDHGKCAMPADWVCTYNKALGLPCPVPAAAAS